MELTAKNVTDIFMNCLFNDGEDTEGYVLGEGVMHNVGFHPDRLKSSEESIVLMLGELSDTFKKEGGGGTSFLQMCEDKNGHQWADLHQTMDQLVCLGYAVGKLKFLMPRESWVLLPGGMPYIVIE